jgi:hypothetical protein
MEGRVKERNNKNYYVRCVSCGKGLKDFAFVPQHLPLVRMIPRIKRITTKPATAMPPIPPLLKDEGWGEVEGAVEWSVDVAVVIVSDINDVRDVSDVSDDVCVEAVIVEDWNAEALRQLNWQPYSFKQLFEILLFDASLTSHQSVAREIGYLLVFSGSAVPMSSQ